MKKVNKKRINPLAVDAEFKQTGGSCVLASYALAAHYFTQIPMSKFFDGYCEHFGLLPLAQEETSESVYASHFDSEWRRRGVRGYEVVLEIHNRSHVSVFVCARKMMRGTFFFHTDARLVEKVLRKRKAFLNVAYNAGHEFHSISIFSDGKYLFGRDTNRKNCFLINTGLKSIGVLRDSVLYEAK